MVTLIPKYEQKVYKLNTGDDPGDVEFHNGDQILLMDANALLVFDEEANNWYPVPTGGGGFTPADEGKVVYGGVLVSQHSDTATSNGTVDTTLINSLTVAVPTGYSLESIVKGLEPSGDVVVDGYVLKSSHSLSGCTNITSLTHKNANYSGTYSYLVSSCTQMQTAVLVNITNSNASLEYMFSGCTALTAFDGNNNALHKFFFNNCGQLATLVLRKTSLMTLAATSAFNGTPFNSGGTGGHIYIPKTLYDALGTGTNDYKAASNWSTVDGYGTITWHPIEGSIYETQYVDGTTIPTT